MDKKTIIAVVLAVVIIIGSMVVQSVFFSREQPASVRTTQTAQPEERPAESAEQEKEAPKEPAAPLSEQPPSVVLSPAQAAGEVREEKFTIDTEVFRIGFTNRGGQVTSVQLKEYSNVDGSPVEMIFNQDSGVYPFSIHFGDSGAPAVDELFEVERSLTGGGVTFSRTFFSQSGVPFKLIKRYVLHPRDYLIELRVSIENSVNEYPALDYGGYAYTLGFGPQIGPEFEKLDRRNEYRNYMYYSEGKKKNIRIPKERFTQIDARVTWAAIVGKYFEMIAVPDSTPYLIMVDTRPIAGLNERSSLYFSRPQIKSSRNIDVFRFYLGPKKRDVLLRYNDANKNAYKLSDMHFEETISSSVLIGWLAAILKFFLELFYRIIPNYGVAIILLTILIKALLYPLTRKSYESTSRMQALQPKISELREKYKSNPQKLNQEMAALYKREGVSPLGGCLPMLLQLPIFFALYNLLSNHFELRGAVFISGWINDLSSPESVWDFAPLSIPIVGWHNLRILPFVMLITTFVQSKFMQSPSTDSSGRNMRMMTYMMPLIFFFILYDMPSGLVLYWTMQNILTIFQQMYTNYRRRKKNAGGEPGSGSVRRKK